jgi:class 3 adenylate cyclase
MSQTRRLIAILAADVAGYSRLMGADEEGTHERLQAHLRELVNPKINEHRGRIVKNTGDGFLAEFASVVDAVRCAVEVQCEMAKRNADSPSGKRIEFRIGINLGDVIAEGEDIFGDGVNVAARLEALAEPGGICVSRMVRDNVRDKLDYALEDLGQQQVKNIARPVRVYALHSKALTALPPKSPMRPFRYGRLVIVSVTAAALVIACVGWWFWPTPTFFLRAGKPAETAVAQMTQIQEKCQKLSVTKYEWGQDNPKHPSLFAFIRNDDPYNLTSASFYIYFLIGKDFKVGEGRASIRNLMSGHTEEVPVLYTVDRDISGVTLSFLAVPTTCSFSQ